MRILALNPGSSSLRFRCADIGESGDSMQCAAGAVSSLGPGAKAWAARGAERGKPTPARLHDAAEAAEWTLQWIRENLAADGPRGAALDGVGIRFVHGGERFRATTLVDDEVLRALDVLQDLAPLHNTASLAVLRTVRGLVGPRLPVAAVFDTAFHATLPEVARAYALPHELVARHGLRRFGFHGLALRSVVDRLAAWKGAEAAAGRLVALHLGSGCSVSAIRGGRSIDTSMGFSPLEGLVMSTRSGDVDPTVVLHLARHERTRVEEVIRWLSDRSGLLGVSGVSSDFREIERLRGEGHERAALAFDLFVHRARKHLAGAIAVLGGVDHVVFSGGIGEHSRAARLAILSAMEWSGIRIDPERNDAVGSEPATISSPDAAVHAHVVPADEETVLLRETSLALASAGRGSSSSRSPAPGPMHTTQSTTTPSIDS